MIIDIDVGNTCLKWRSRDRATELLVADDIASLVAVLASTGVEADFCIASVRQASFNEVLESALAPYIRTHLHWAKTTSKASGVSCAYAEPECLGVDRWSALVAAYHLWSGPILLVDAGTAATIDAVDTTGQHLGGYIVPGLSLLRSSLNHYTAKIAVAETEWSRWDSIDEERLGCSTEAAVNYGAVDMLRSTVEVLANRYVRRWGAVTLVLTGGDAAILDRDYGERVTVVRHQNLVLEGLRWLLPS